MYIYNYVAASSSLKHTSEQTFSSPALDIVVISKSPEHIFWVRRMHNKLMLSFKFSNFQITQTVARIQMNCIPSLPYRTPQRVVCLFPGLSIVLFETRSFFHIWDNELLFYKSY